MNAPTQDQVLAAGRHVVSYAMGGVSMFAALHLITGGDAQSAANALNTIGHGFSEIVAGVATLATVATGAYAAFSANPLVQLLRGSKAVAADPAKQIQLQTATVDQKAALVSVTDKLPEVAGVGTTSTDAGKALADAVPSNTVQPVK
jgi:hypothetical protein